MNIGIIFAMQEELDALKNNIKIIKEEKIYDLTFYISKLNNKKIILVESGVGKVNASRTTQVLIDKYKIDLIINIGVAGGIDKDLNIFDIVVGEILYQHDFDITAFNHNKGYIPKIGDYIKTNKDLINKIKQIDKTNKYHLKYGVIATGDIFITDEKMSQKINKKFNALCVEMESSAIAQTSLLSNVPFLILRSISDTPNNNNKISYEKFLTKSSQIISDIAIDIINNL